MFGIGGAIEAVAGIVGKFIPDPEQAAKAEAALRDSLVSWDKGQLDVNKAEATHRSIFVAGWRPFIGWTCGAAFAYHFVFQPIILIILKANGVEFELPEFDMAALSSVLMGMLGLGGLRTFEKLKGLTK
tara:strand:- start:214 stop:600 length:387 start_codon:yes stop_codon:yes gene_type:complete